MVSFKIIYLTTSVVVVQQAVGVSRTATQPTFQPGNSVDCLPEFNAARKAAQLNDLIKATGSNIIPAYQQKANNEVSVWGQICSSSIDESKLPGYKAFALLPPQSSAPTCDQAVTKWNLAANNFTTRPPKFTAQEALYKNSDNMSLIHLYNPKVKTTLDCQSFSCKVDDKITTHGLMCLTMPYPLVKDEYPFTEAEWDHIKKGIANSSTMAVPSLLAVAAAAAAIAIF